MRRVLALAALIGFISAGTAVVGGPNASEGEMVIMDSSSSSSASAAVGPNGTEWRSSIENLNNSCVSSERNSSVEFVGFQSDGNLTKLSFKGSLTTPNPCYELSLNVKEVEKGLYRLEIMENSSSKICVQCLGSARFRASFSAEGDYKIKVIHDGEIIGTQKTPGYSKEKPVTNPEEAGIMEGLTSIIQWFRSLL